MICIHCGHSQETGKFCGKCGTKFEYHALTENSVNQERLAIAQTVTPNSAQANIHVDHMKEQFNLYTSHFMQQLKSPSLAFREEKIAFTYGLTSIVLFSLLISGSMYLLIPDESWTSGMLSVLINNAVFSLATIAIALVSLFLISRYFGPQLSLKSIIFLYGAHLPLLILCMGVTFLFLLIKSYTVGSFILTITFLLAILALPLYLISSLLTKESTSLDPLYGFILYIITFTIIFMVFLTISADSALGGFMSALLGL